VEKIFGILVVYIFCRSLRHEGLDISRWIWNSVAATYTQSPKATGWVCQQTNDDAPDWSSCQGNFSFVLYKSLWSEVESTEQVVGLIHHLFHYCMFQYDVLPSIDRKGSASIKFKTLMSWYSMTWHCITLCCKWLTILHMVYTILDSLTHDIDIVIFSCNKELTFMSLSADDIDSVRLSVTFWYSIKTT